MIISFSGLDGAGKTTQIQMLLKNYQKMGAKTGSIYNYFPDIRYHSTAELKKLYQALNSYDVIHMRYRLNSDKNYVIMKQLEKNSPPQYFLAVAAAIQGYLDHCELREYVLAPLLRNNKIIIFDRYYYDELAFKYTYGCPNFLLEKIYNNAIDADIKFYIRIPTDECLKRNQFRPDSKVALYQTKRTVNLLLERFDYVAKNKQLITLDGTLNKNEISQSIIKRVPRQDIL